MEYLGEGCTYKSLMADWLEQASQWHEVYCHDLVMRLWVRTLIRSNLGCQRSTYVLSSSPKIFIIPGVNNMVQATFPTSFCFHGYQILSSVQHTESLCIYIFGMIVFLLSQFPAAVWDAFRYVVAFNLSFIWESPIFTWSHINIVSCHATVQENVYDTYSSRPDIRCLHDRL